MGPLLQGFFVEHLRQHKHVSPQTVASYRDTFRLLLQFAHKQLRTEPAALKTAGPGSLDRFLLRLGGSVCRVDDARFLSSLRQLLVQAQSCA